MSSSPRRLTPSQNEALDSPWTGEQSARAHVTHYDYTFDYRRHFRHARVALGSRHDLGTILLQSLHGLLSEPPDGPVGHDPPTQSQSDAASGAPAAATASLDDARVALGSRHDLGTIPLQSLHSLQLVLMTVRWNANPWRSLIPTGATLPLWTNYGHCDCFVQGEIWASAWVSSAGSSASTHCCTAVPLSLQLSISQSR